MSPAGGPDGPGAGVPVGERLLRLTELIGLVDPGPDAGVCYVCGRWTQTGHREPPSDNFTAWADVYHGEVLCERCRPLLKDRRFRATSWLATRDGVRFRTPDDRAWVWSTVLDPPEPPFALYLTRGGKRQGWVRLLPYVAQSRTRFWVGTDWTTHPVLITAAWRDAVVPVLVALRERGVAKGALLTGGYSPKVWDDALTGGWDDLLGRGQAYVGDPRWEVLVYACP